MDIVQSTVLHRKGRKWKSRCAVFRKSAAVPDPCESSMLIMFKDASHRNQKQIFPLWKYAGCMTFTKVEKAENVLMIFTESNTIVLAFDTPRLLNDWYHAIQVQFGKEVTYPVVIPPKQKLKTGESTLFIYNDFFAIINDKSYRCVGRWSSAELGNCAAIDGDFVFEVNQSRNWKGHTYRLKTTSCDDIVQIFDYIKENSSTGMKDNLRNRSDTGSGLIIDMERERRHTLDSSSEQQNFFQRALLRVSNRFRKHSRARAATMGAQKQTRQERLRQLNQASSSNGNGSSNEITKGDISQLPNDLNAQASNIAYKGRSNSHGDFSTEPGRQARVKAQSKNEPTQRSGTPLQNSNDAAIAGNKQGNTNSSNPRRLKSSVGSVSVVSTRSRGLSSTTSDVFSDDGSEKEAKPKQNGPPVAPPRSPVSLGIFTFPDLPDEKEEDENSEYLNKEGIDELTGRTVTSTPTDGSEVILRRKTDNSSLLDEIDHEIKRRTREEDMPSTPLSYTSVDGPNSFDYYDNEEGENYVMLRTTDAGPTVDVECADSQIHSRKQSSEIGSVVKEPLVNEPPVANGNNRIERTVEEELNFDPGVHSPNKLENSGEEAAYQNVTQILEKQRENAAAKGRRNSARRSSSKHLSDPLLTERLGNIQQWHNDNVASSLHELPHETNYVNYKENNGSGDKSSFYVNVSAGEGAVRKNRKKKPSPLNFNFEKYDDDEKIYHNVGPLVSDRSGSSDGFGSYKNIGGGSYENVAGRSTSRDRAYVNVPSPSHKKAVPMLNYVLVSSSKGSSSHGYRGERSGSVNSVNSDKSDKVPYSYIDEKATSLLQRTREQHWQRRAEDGQAKLNTPKKTKKSFGD